MATPLFFLMTAYLIDGYNLLHVMGVLPKKVPPGGLAKARLGLLDGLSKFFAGKTATVTVVFDAAKAPPGTHLEQDYQGIAVRFAPAGSQADDVIESLIQQQARPSKLTVVSNDHRLQRAARRRDATPMSCEAFLDVLASRSFPEATAHPTPAEKSEPADDADRERWLKEFNYLDKDLEKLDFRFFGEQNSD